MAAKEEEEEEASHVAPITVSPEKRRGENGWMETPADRKEEEDDRPRKRGPKHICRVQDWITQRRRREEEQHTC